MKQFKTVKGLINHLKQISIHQTFMHLKGYDKLTDEQKQELSFVSGSISNAVGVLDSKTSQSSKKSKNDLLPDVSDTVCKHIFIPAGEKWGVEWEECMKCGYGKQQTGR